MPLLLLLLLFQLSYSDTALNLVTSSGEQGHWSVFSDSQDGGGSIAQLVRNQDTPSNSSTLRLSYQLKKDHYEWEPYGELQLSFITPSPFKTQKYQALQYRYRGASHAIILKSTDVTDWAYHERLMPQSAQWSTVAIPLPTGFYQQDWGEAKELVLSHIEALGWRITGEDGDSGTLDINSIILLDTFAIVPQNNLALRSQEVPKKKRLDPLTVERNPLQAKAQKYLNKGVSLHNWLEENAPFKDFRYSKEDIIRFKKQGFEGVRFPIDLDLYVIDKDQVVAGSKPLTLDSLIWTPLDSMVAWTEELGLSLTIDYHQYDASLTNTTVFDAGYRAMASGVWKKVAQRYSSNPRADIFYELTNEPGISGEVSRKGWRELSEQMIDSIRSVDTVHTLIWGDSRWYEIEQLIKNTPFEEQNIIYSFHYYEPFLFTHQGASWTGMGSTKNTPFPYSKDAWNTEYEYFGIQEGTPDWIKDQYQSYYKMGNRTAMYNQVLVAKKWANKHNVALINNEFGAHPKVAKPAELVAYFATICSIFEELEIPWQVWFGPFDQKGELLKGMKKALDL